MRETAETTTPVRAYLGVGSNIEPERNILEALRLLAEHVRVTGISTFYRTKPVGGRRQPRFLNGVWRIETATAARPLKFEVLRDVERRLGRVRSADAYAPRTIDLDILLYGHAVIAEADLTIPDPDIALRPFFAVPLLEFDPDLTIPGSGESLAARVQPEDRAELEAETAFTEKLRKSASKESVDS